MMLGVYLGHAGTSSRLALDDQGRVSIEACLKGAAPPVPRSYRDRGGKHT